MVSVTEKLKFYFISININLNLNSHVCLVASMLDSTILEHSCLPLPLSWMRVELNTILWVCFKGIIPWCRFVNSSSLLFIKTLSKKEKLWVEIISVVFKRGQWTTKEAFSITCDNLHSFIHGTKYVEHSTWMIID